MATGSLLADLSLSGRTAEAVDLHSTGHTVVSVEGHKEIDLMRRWDVTGERGFLRRLPVRLPWPEPDPSGNCGGTVSPGGARVMFIPCGEVAPALANSYVFLDVASRRVRIARHAISGFHFGLGSWRPDQPTFLRADGDTIREFDTRSARLLQTRRMDGLVADVAYSPDGTVVVVGQLNGDVTLLSAQTLEALASPLRLDDSIISIGIGPDNRTAFRRDLPRACRPVLVVPGEQVVRARPGPGAS
ncbi:hypothetical protein [Nocardioides sp. B-3]|uniref:hypothetical protein n=1 Tax=Nocardioides sp. B-3 TaxID=2895565 RepID=UPI0021521537|nr:hypothetical protein [Nocardioides sp. B-3]UUZ57697.1 hypothetical protein LP418_14765 [Nocardioides sp. B-3]